MYNRYIPGSDGNYRCERVPSPADHIPAPVITPPAQSDPVAACAPSGGGLTRSFGKIETGTCWCMQFWHSCFWTGRAIS